MGCSGYACGIFLSACILICFLGVFYAIKSCAELSHKINKSSNEQLRKKE